MTNVRNESFYLRENYLTILAMRSKVVTYTAVNLFSQTEYSHKNILLVFTRERVMLYIDQKYILFLFASLYPQILVND